MEPSSTRVMLFDDHAGLAALLVRLIGARPGLRAASCTTADPRRAAAAAARCDVAVVDVQLGQASGIDLVRRLAATRPAPRLLALSSHDAPAFVEAMLAAGALGYVLKDDPLDELVRAIHAVAAGRRHLSRALLSLHPGLAANS